MFKTIRNAWGIPDLRRKLIFTVLIVIAFRVGSVIPVPFLDMDALSAAMASLSDVNSTASSSALAYLNTLSGGAFSNATIFAMGVTPYINASIIMQLLTVAIPSLEQLQKEGQEGRNKIQNATRYVSIGIAII